MCPENRAGDLACASEISQTAMLDKVVEKPGEATQSSAESSDPEDEENDENSPTGVRFAILYACILLGNFFTGYDTSCVTTLTPILSDEFNGIADVGWYGVSYILASTSTLLTFGKIYTMFPMKFVFMASYLVFAAGSAVSASANSSAAFIVGRAVSGLGSAGIFSGGSIILSRTTALKHRATYQGISGGMECVALALGPLMSGAIAHVSSWRVAFYILIPIAVFNIIALGFCVPRIAQRPAADVERQHWARQLDLLGLVLFIPANVCFTLALQWAGTVYPWKNARIITLLVLSGVFGIAFVFVEHRHGDGAMFPLRLLRQRSVTLGAISQFCISASLFIFAFYLPIYFQAIRGASTLGSGLMYLPSALSFAIAIFSAGYITSVIGYYTPVMALGTVMLALGSGLMTTFSIASPRSAWIGYQVVYGIGAGLAFQQTYTAVQTVLPERFVPTALVCLSFTQELGGVVALTLAQNVFLNLTVSRLLRIVPGLDRQKIVEQGTVGLPQSLPAEYQTAAYQAYNRTIVDVFYIGLAAAILTICSMGIEWKSVREHRSSTHDAPNETTDQAPSNN